MAPGGKPIAADGPELRPEISALFATARQQALDGRHRKAIDTLWKAEGQTRYSAVETTALLEVASELEKSGARKEDYGRLLNTARYFLASAETPPVSPYRRGMPVSTSNDVPGWEVTSYIGEVFGLIVRSRGAFAQFGATLKAGSFGGELKTMTNLFADTRKDAIARMVDEAQSRGADAIIAMRFDVTAMGEGAGSGAGWTEVCAYGTAVRATKHADRPDAPGS